MPSKESHNKLEMRRRLGRGVREWGCSVCKMGGGIVTNWLKSGLLSFIHLKCKSREADTEHTQLSSPLFFLSHLHWKDCRVHVNAEAHELHGTERSPLSQFILPHVDEHGRTLSKSIGNSTQYPSMHNIGMKTRVQIMLTCLCGFSVI